jgi:multisubunit Na+/H+ antiporter MnhB subunit
MTDEALAATAPATLRTLRRLLLGILMLGVAGTSVELILLKHLDGALQLIPLAMLAAAFVTCVWHAIRRTSRSVRVLRVLMLLFVVAGGFGIVLHYRANVEYQLESDPGLKGRALMGKVLAAKSPPALAPGVMAQLGLLGLAYVYRHPALRAGAQREGATR